MKKLLAVVFLSSILVLSLSMNVILFFVNESNIGRSHSLASRSHRLEGRVTQVERQRERIEQQAALVQQRLLICDQLLQECMDMPDTEPVRDLGSKNGQPLLTRF